MKSSRFKYPTVCQAIALIGINILALIYDSQYVPFALGVDALVLGVELKSALMP